MVDRWFHLPRTRFLGRPSQSQCEQINAQLLFSENTMFNEITCFWWHKIGSVGIRVGIEKDKNIKHKCKLYLMRKFRDHCVFGRVFHLLIRQSKSLCWLMSFEWNGAKRLIALRMFNHVKFCVRTLCRRLAVRSNINWWVCALAWNVMGHIWLWWYMQQQTQLSNLHVYSKLNRFNTLLTNAILMKIT